MISIAGSQKLSRRLSVEAGLIEEPVMWVDPFFLAVAFKDNLTLKSIYPDYVSADKVFSSELILQIALSVIEIPAAFPCPVRPPEDVLSVIENVIGEKLFVVMRLADR